MNLGEIHQHLILLIKIPKKDPSLSVLNSISICYQKYSGKRRLREIEPSINYSKKQILILKKKIIEALKKAY